MRAPRFFHRVARLRAAVLSAAALALAGCVTYRAKPITAEGGAAAVISQPFCDDGLRRFMSQNLGLEPAPWPPVRWDLTLLTLAAWYRNPDMALARSQVAVAEADIRIAGERPEPGINLAPEYVGHGSPDLHPWTLGFSFDLPLETAGKRGKRVAVASARVQSARDQLAATAWQVRSRLRSSLLALWSAQSAANLQNQRLSDQEILTRFLKTRFESGEASSYTLAQARIALDQNRLAARSATNQERLARIDLARTIGVPVSALSDVRIDFGQLAQAPTAAVPPQDELRRLALQSRSDIQAGLADYAVAEAALRLEIAKQYPDIHLDPGYTWDQGLDRWLVGFNFSLPIFNRNRGAIGRAEADREAAAVKFEALQTKILGDLESAMTNYESSRGSLKFAEDLLQRQQSSSASIEKQFEAGEIGRFELTGARLQYDEAALAKLTVLVQAQANLGALEDAVQRPLDGTGPAIFPISPPAPQPESAP